MERKARGKERHFIHSFIRSVNKLGRASSFFQVSLNLGEQMRPSSRLIIIWVPGNGWGRALSSHSSLVGVTNYSVWIRLLLLKV